MITADFVVVGGGIAGVSVAAALAEHGSLVLLEREDMLAQHATGRSIAAFLQSYGSSQVQSLTRLSLPLIDQASADSGIPLLEPRPLLWIANQTQSEGIDGLVSTTPSLQRIDISEAIMMCNALRPDYLHAAAIERDAADINAMGLHAYYLGELIHKGGVVLTNAALLNGRYRAGSWLIHTSAGDFSAGLVVNAAGAWADDVGESLGGLRVGLCPKRRTVAVSATPRVDNRWPLVLDLDERFYFRPHPGGVLVSPADETDHPPSDAKVDPRDVALALERVNAATALGLRSVRRAWAGLRTFARDQLPVVGFDPAAPKMLWVAGQGGFGIQASPAIALVAAAVVTNDGFVQQFQTERLNSAVFAPSRFTTGR